MTQELVVLKPGPGTKYEETACLKVVEAASRGAHIPGMMLSLGVKSKDTWYRWQKEYPEFKEAVEFAKVVSQAFYEELGLAGIQGKIKDFNATTFALMMNNKFGEEYKRSSSGGGNTEITLNTVNYSSDQVNQKIAQKLEKLKSLGLDLTNESE